MKILKNLSLLALSAIVVGATLTSIGADNTASPSKTTPSMFAKASNTLNLRQEPNAKSKTTLEIGFDQDFTVEQSDWVQIKLANGKQGWALRKDVQAHLDKAYQASYQVELSGTQADYKVRFVNPEEVKKRIKLQEERAQKRWRAFSQSMRTPFLFGDIAFHSPFSDDLAVEDKKIEELEAKILELEKALKKQG